jgi:branched-chain amino acid transport system permease protein
MDIWGLRLLDGLTFGCYLFLVASGFTLGLGVMKIVNIAYGALYALAAYTAWNIYEDTNNFVLMLLGAMGIAMGVGFVIQQTVLRRLYLKPLPQILVTFGVTLIIVEFCQIAWQGFPRQVSLESPSWLVGGVELGSIFYPKYRLFYIAVAAIVALILWLLLERTKFGALVRACVDDEEMARGMGVNVPRLYAVVFALSSVLAGLAGGIGVVNYGVDQGAAFTVLLYALIIVVIGGLGSVSGALAASIIVGLVDSIGKSLFPDLAYFTLYVPMIVMLLVRPSGLRGGRT